MPTAPLRIADGWAAPVEHHRWALWHRIGFRFLFCYFVLYWFPAPLSFVLPDDWTYHAYEKPIWYRIVPWVAKHLLDLGEIPLQYPNGSGDSTFRYVQCLCFAVLAGVATLVWSALARRRPHHGTLQEYFLLYLRYMLACTLFTYGILKALPSQYVPPTGDELVRRFGDSSPMGLLWTFMNYSTSYTVFAGLVELLGGVLLAFRRTTALGALVSAAAMSNVVVLNFSYDVPVKQLSSHLLLMSLLLLAPHVPRLLRFFVLNRAVEPAVLGPPPLQGLWRRRVVTGVKLAFLGGFLVLSLKDAVQAYLQWGHAATFGPHTGLYAVEELVRDGRVVPPLTSETTRWQWFYIGRWNRGTIRAMDHTLRMFQMRLDEEKRTLTLTEAPKYLLKPPPDSKKVVFHYTSAGDGTLILEGTEPERIRATLRKVDPSSFPLSKRRGFRWVNELPFNR